MIKNDLKWTSKTASILPYVTTHIYGTSKG